jgi:hypothetical protein
MSSFLIVPRNVYGQLKCCTASGISDPVPAPIGLSFFFNYVAENLGDPLHWKLAGAIGNNGSVGFGVCCGTKEFSVEYSFFVGLSSLAGDFGGVSLAVNSNIHDAYFVFVFVEKDYLLGGYELTIITGETSTTTNVPSLSDFYFTLTINGSFTATACNGVAFFNGAIDTTTNPPTSVPATVTAQFSIT